MPPAQIEEMKATIKSFKTYVKGLPHIRHKVSPDKLGITISLHDGQSPCKKIGTTQERTITTINQLKLCFK